MQSSLPHREELYQALLDRDSSYEGIFVVAVRTTGIFCRPTCSARKPKIENVEFYKTARDAIQYGYRPCKICRPMGYKDEVPGWLQPLLTEIENDPTIRLKDYDLAQRGIDPNRLRRWFKKHHGMTFQAYLRSLRIGQAFGRIVFGEKVIHAAYNSGYESLSGFADSFKKMTGFSPTLTKKEKVITINRIVSPLGPMIAGATDEGICLLEFIDRRMLETQFKRLRSFFKAEFIPGTHELFAQLSEELDAYFAGKLQYFSVPTILRGTEFQEKVWNVLQTIPYGQTISYAEQAQKLGNPKAVRAVAKANGDNKIAILIPCHRVIGKDGNLTGYGGGLWRKKYLLELETGNY